MPFPTRYPKRKEPTRLVPLRKPDPWWKALFDGTVGIIIICIYAVLLPMIKVGMFNWMVWNEWKKGNWQGAVAIAVFGIGIIDIGIIWGIVLICQGKLRIW